MGEDCGIKRAYLGVLNGHRLVGQPRYGLSPEMEAHLREVNEWPDIVQEQQA